MYIYYKPETCSHNSCDEQWSTYNAYDGHRIAFAILIEPLQCFPGQYYCVLALVSGGRAPAQLCRYTVKHSPTHVKYNKSVFKKCVKITKLWIFSENCNFFFSEFFLLVIGVFTLLFGLLIFRTPFKMSKMSVCPSFCEIIHSKV